MASKTEICNLALSHLGTAKPIANLETDKGNEANACRRFFDIAIKTTLSDFAWPFATRFEALPLVGENPNKEWNYSYRYPVDCLDARRILSGIRNDTEDSRIVFKIAKDANGKLIYTDEALVVLEYTEYVQDPSFYSDDFTLASSFRLAYYMVSLLSKGDPFKIRADMFQSYVNEVGQARKRALSEEQPDKAPTPSLIRARR